MTVFTGRGLLVSLPGAELAGIDLPGSISELHEVAAASISPELRAALHLLRDHAVPDAFPIKCLARPEVFVCGRAQAWLEAQTEGILHHVCLSDGSTIKPLPPFATHVFFYRRAFRDNCRALQRLFRRAPELAGTVASQVNSCFALADQPASRSMFINRLSPADHPPALLLPFVLNRHSAEDSANRILQHKPIAPEALSGFAEIRYLLLTQTALADAGFAHWLGAQLLAAFYTPTRLTLLRLPSVMDGPNRLTRQITSMLPTLRRAGLRLPQTAPKNLIFLTEDIAENHPLLARMPYQVFVHESFDYWRYTRAFFARAASVTVVRNGQSPHARGFLPDTISEIYGPNAAFHPIDVPR